jgi:hypothetical protein
MSNCGCKGYYHDRACSDKNVIFWLGLDGKLPKTGIPVNPTEEEIATQNEIVKKRLKLPSEGVRILTPEELAR